MGREIRRVPPNWQHPKQTKFDWRLGREIEFFQPLYKRNFAEAMDEWYAEWKKWESGDRDPNAPAGMQYHEWDSGPPDPYYYQHGIKAEDCTWFQVYETVTEGTPVSPPFATTEELVQYLAEHGDFWDQQRIQEGRQSGPAGWGIEAARKFVGAGWAPSMLVTNGVIKTARDGI